MPSSYSKSRAEGAEVPPLEQWHGPNEPTEVDAANGSAPSHNGIRKSHG